MLPSFYFLKYLPLFYFISLSWSFHSDSKKSHSSIYLNFSTRIHYYFFSSFKEIYIKLWEILNNAANFSFIRDYFLVWITEIGLTLSEFILHRFKLFPWRCPQFIKLSVIQTLSPSSFKHLLRSHNTLSYQQKSVPCFFRFFLLQTRPRRLTKRLTLT